MAHQAISLETPPTVFRPSATRTIARCTVDGRVTYADSCAGSPVQELEVEAAGGQTPAGLTAYQREMLRSADARIARDAAAARAEMAALQRAAVDSRMECDALAESIRSLDAWARQPLSGSQQDGIRRRQQELTSRRYRLRCP